MAVPHNFFEFVFRWRLQGEMIVIPKGVEHKPSSVNGYKALLIEPEDTPNTGNVKSDVTIKNIEWI